MPDAAHPRDVLPDRDPLGLAGPEVDLEEARCPALTKAGNVCGQGLYPGAEDGRCFAHSETPAVVQERTEGARKGNRAMTRRALQEYPLPGPPTSVEDAHKVLAWITRRAAVDPTMPAARANVIRQLAKDFVQVEERVGQERKLRDLLQDRDRVLQFVRNLRPRLCEGCREVAREVRVDAAPRRERSGAGHQVVGVRGDVEELDPAGREEARTPTEGAGT